jgi:hypothetical protein
VDGWSVLDPVVARWALRSLLAQPEARRAVLDALQRSGGATLPVDHGASAALERAVERRSLLVFEQPIAAVRLGLASQAIVPAPPHQPHQPHRPRAWIDITVVDDSVPAEPIQGARFRLRLPDGSTRTSALDDQGRVYIDDIEPGQCWLELIEPGHRGA